MKKVIFICLLSFSMCLSGPTVQPEHPDQTPAAVTVKSTTEVPAAAPAQPTQPPAAPQGAPDTAQAANKTTPDKNNTTPVVTPTDDKKTTTPVPTKHEDDKKDGNKVDPSKDKTTTPIPAPTPDTHTTEKDKQSTTTKKAEISTEKPTDAPSKKGEEIPVQAKGFDGASFIGGIILTLGLLAIGFMGFKYYKNQTERNYHTL